MDFRNDPKLRGMADRISSHVTNPPPSYRGTSAAPNPPPSSLSSQQPPLNPPPLHGVAQQPPQNVTQMFQQTSDQITNNGKKKQLMVAGICAGSVFLFCFIFLCAFKPGFVMKKKYDGNVEKKSVNFLSVFIISLTLAAIVMIVGLVTTFKK